MRGTKEFNLEIDPSLDVVFDEGSGNSFLAMRKLRWDENSNFKIDLRKWFTNSDGEEIAGKGFSFITEEGPNNLVNCLIDNGFGDTKDIVESISKRDDFIDALAYSERALDALGLDELKDKVKKVAESAEAESFYDPKELLG